jgi:hypothetical protein
MSSVTQDQKNVFASRKDSIMKTMPSLIRMLCSLTAATSLCSEAEVFNFNVTADLSDPSIYMNFPQNNITTIVFPLVDQPSSAFGSGDTLNVSIGFESGQRLGLTAHPTGQSAPLGEQGIGLFVSNSSLAYSLSGSLESSVSLIDPAGAYVTDSASATVGFGSTQGALTRQLADWTDTAFSVAGFAFQIDINEISQPVLPNEIMLEFREFQIQAIPEPATGLLLLTAAGILRFVRPRGKAKQPPNNAPEPTASAP